MISHRLYGRACLGFVILLAACDATGPEGPRTLDFALPGAVDLDTGALDSITGAGRGNELQIYARSGAPWLAFVPAIPVAPRGNVAPSVATCRAATDWNYFETEVASMPPISYFCVKTSKGAVGWVKVEHFSGVNTAVRVTFDVTP